MFLRKSKNYKMFLQKLLDVFFFSKMKALQKGGKKPNSGWLIPSYHFSSYQNCIPHYVPPFNYFESSIYTSIDYLISATLHVSAPCICSWGRMSFFTTVQSTGQCTCNCVSVSTFWQLTYLFILYHLLRVCVQFLHRSLAKRSVHCEVENWHFCKIWSETVNTFSKFWWECKVLLSKVWLGWV